MYVLEAESGFFLYENKNTHEILIIPVYMNDKNRQLVESTFEWMRKVRQYHKDKELPKIPFRKNAKECKDCPVKAVCWDGETFGEGTVDVEPLRLL